MTGKLLFKIPIPPCGEKNPGGDITVTEPAPQVYLMTITSGPDNRITTASVTAILDALDLLEFSPDKYPPGVLITTSGLPKFYSNGLDLEHALATEDFMPTKLYKMFARFLTYPMPTVALINGHAFAAGIMTAMHHDYRIMNPTRGFVCVNELDFGVPLTAAMSSIFRIKTSPATYRKLLLEAHRFGGPEAVEAGIVDAVGGLDEALRFVAERKLTQKPKSGIYGLLKSEMYRESMDLLCAEGHEREVKRVEANAVAEEERRAVGERRVGEIKGRAKL